MAIRGKIILIERRFMQETRGPGGRDQGKGESSYLPVHRYGLQSLSSPLCQAAVDFFGRTKIVPSTNVTTESTVDGVTTITSGPPAKKFRLIYRFNEGSSSAVRKPVKMMEML